jgi:hypothetical protein
VVRHQWRCSTSKSKRCIVREELQVQLVTVHRPVVGRMVVVVDPFAVCMEPMNKESPWFKVMSENRHKNMRLDVCLGNGPGSMDALVCTCTGCTLPTRSCERYLGDDIMHRADDHVALRSSIERMNRGVCSSLYRNDAVISVSSRDATSGSECRALPWMHHFVRMST